MWNVSYFVVPLNVWPTGIVTQGPKMYPELISAITQQTLQKSAILGALQAERRGTPLVQVDNIQEREPETGRREDLKMTMIIQYNNLMV